MFQAKALRVYLQLEAFTVKLAKFAHRKLRSVVSVGCSTAQPNGGRLQPPDSERGRQHGGEEGHGGLGPAKAQVS